MALVHFTLPTRSSLSALNLSSTTVPQHSADSIKCSKKMQFQSLHNWNAPNTIWHPKRWHVVSKTRTRFGRKNFRLSPCAMADEMQEGAGDVDAAEEASRSRARQLAALEATIGKKKRPRQKASIENYQEPLPVVVKKKKKAWESMSMNEKVTELWLGDTGGLFWLNKLAWGSIIGIAFLWVCFRFVGPGIGLYGLENGLLDPHDAF